jgi:hypothetical protein
VPGWSQATRERRTSGAATARAARAPRHSLRARGTSSARYRGSALRRAAWRRPLGREILEARLVKDRELRLPLLFGTCPGRTPLVVWPVHGTELAVVRRARQPEGIARCRDAQLRAQRLHELHHGFSSSAVGRWTPISSDTLFEAQPATQRTSPEARPSRVRASTRRRPSQVG